MAGGMEVHKNKFVEQWATNRENLEMVFRFNRRTIPICLTFGLALPLLTYYGIVAEFVLLMIFAYLVTPWILFAVFVKQLKLRRLWLRYLSSNLDDVKKSHRNSFTFVQKHQDKLEGRSRKFL